MPELLVSPPSAVLSVPPFSHKLFDAFMMMNINLMGLLAWLEMASLASFVCLLV